MPTNLGDNVGPGLEYGPGAYGGEVQALVVPQSYIPTVVLASKQGFLNNHSLENQNKLHIHTRFLTFKNRMKLTFHTGKLTNEQEKSIYKTPFFNFPFFTMKSYGTYT
jgi:hypothetical protein